ncbi:hypothetical protein M422DRAFT_49674 [Sphaerobolus stellatus SS14]|uniref:RING-14 protein n=1 Tax=Sphaerobolus stellatus (strain SS14) TaxID=990650 RepID=A0A0C9VNE5_SPHS4|nr:hypothetical protein M422DRAFT_49674 [Sphaerobolus stellatus SS14]
MHFAKTYSQLLLTLPNEFRNSAIEYRQLKKLIKELVAELEALGLTPDVLQDLLQRENVADGASKGKERAHGERSADANAEPLLSVSLPESVVTESRISLSSSPARVIYELEDVDHKGEIVPRLRLWLKETTLRLDAVKAKQGGLSSAKLEEIPDSDSDVGTEVGSEDRTSNTPNTPVMKAEKIAPDEVVAITPLASHSKRVLLWDLQERPSIRRASSWSEVSSDEGPVGWTINDDIVHADDDAMFNIVEITDNNTDIQSPLSPVNDKDNSHEVIIPLASDTAFFRLLRNALESLSSALLQSEEELKRQIQVLARVVSDTSRPASAGGKSDLYTWRAIFQLYMESQVFESTSERDRGDRSLEDSENRLALFARRVGESGFNFNLVKSRNGLERFLELNLTLMNIKKFQHANAEAARKILKKHAKRTALPLPTSATELIPALEIGSVTASIPHVLVVSLTESLMPIIPVIDDYLCLICTSIAFKPIRLDCGHLFCVRCLVKMQKTGNDHCPMCRAPTVLIANKANLDHALSNFMLDWFPVETKEKAKSNDLESTKEQMEELGIDTRCLIM